MGDDRTSVEAEVFEQKLNEVPVNTGQGRWARVADWVINTWPQGDLDNCALKGSISLR